MKTLLLTLALAGTATADLVSEVRALVAKNDYLAAERAIAAHRSTNGETPQSILATSWLGRGAQAARRWDEAERYAAETRNLCLDQLKRRALDAEPQLPLALGASIEVQAHVLAGRNQRTEAVSFLQEELKAWYKSSIRTRIQKNIHLLSLEGKPAPPLDSREYLGRKPPPLRTLKGRPLVLFFWAHWCRDCKAQVPVLARLAGEFGKQGLVVMGPTQRYGYVAGGREAASAEETRYIESVLREHYGPLAHMTVPVSEENFRSWGSSTTPTLVLVDRGGTVRLYHPGKMSYEELQPLVAKLM